MAQKTYTKAPITEAIIDLRVKLPEGTGVSQLLACQSPEETTYTTRKDIRVVQGVFEAGATIKATTSSEERGFMFISNDGKQLYQARLDGFSMNRLAPYENWISFRDEGKRLWTNYRKATTPEAIERIAVRYVNRIDLPGERVDLKDYLRVAPETPDDLGPVIGGYLLSLNVPYPDLQCTMLLNEAMVEPTRPGIISVILDIDLFRETQIPQDDKAIWELFELFHIKKNAIFESCITEKTRRLFE